MLFTLPDDRHYHTKLVSHRITIKEASAALKTAEISTPYKLSRIPHDAHESLRDARTDRTQSNDILPDLRLKECFCIVQD